MLRIPPAWSANLCSRCQHRVFARASLTFPLPRPPQLRWLTQTRRLRQTDIAESAPIIDEGPFHDGFSISYEPFDGPIIRYEHSGGPSPEQKIALKHALGVNALGKPANVFVFEPEQEKKRAQGFEASVKQKSHGVFDLDEGEILKRIQDGVGIVGMDDACAHIDELRSSWEQERHEDSSWITDEQYNELYEKLSTGFTKVQLQTYVIQKESTRTMDESDLSQEFRSDEYTRSSWSRGETPVTNIRAPYNTRESLVALSGDQFSTMLKEDIANIILDELWQIVPPSRELKTGELDIRLRWAPFMLIMKHRDTFLKALSEQYGVKIEAFPDSKVIRLTSTRDVCGDIVRLIIFKAKSTQKRLWTFKGSESSFLTLRVLKAIVQEGQRLTNTVIEWVGDPKPGQIKYNIYYFGSQPNDFAATARFLNASIENYGSRYISCLWAYHITSEQLSTAIVDVAAKVSFVDRAEQWFRWMYPIPMLPQASGKSTGLVPFAPESPKGAFKGMEFVQGALSNFFDLAGVNLPNIVPAGKSWSNDVMINREIKYGQILSSMSSTSKVRYYMEKQKRQIASVGALQKPSEGTMSAEVLTETSPIDETTMDEPSDAREPARTQTEAATHKDKPAQSEARFRSIAKGLSSSQQIFLPLPGGMISKMRKIETDTFKWEEIVITLRAKTSDTVPRSMLDSIPALRLILKNSRTERDLKLSSARLIVEEKNLGLHCPGQQHDLMATYSVYFEAPIRAVDPKIRDFIKASQVNLWGTENLSTPDGLQLSIPTFATKKTKIDGTISPKTEPEMKLEAKAEGKASATAAPSEPPTILVDYAYSSLECHSCIGSIYTERNKVIYSTIEAGRGGGRRDQTSLSCVAALPINKFALYKSPTNQTQAAKRVRKFQQSLGADLFKASREFMSRMINPTKDSKLHKLGIKKQEKAKKEKEDAQIRLNQEIEAWRQEAEFRNDEDQNADGLAMTEVIVGEPEAYESREEAFEEELEEGFEEDSGAIKAVQDMFNRNRADEATAAVEAAKAAEIAEAQAVIDVADAEEAAKANEAVSVIEAAETDDQPTHLNQELLDMEDILRFGRVGPSQKGPIVSNKLQRELSKKAADDYPAAQSESRTKATAEVKAEITPEDIAQARFKRMKAKKKQTKATTEATAEVTADDIAEARFQRMKARKREKKRAEVTARRAVKAATRLEKEDRLATEKAEKKAERLKTQKEEEEDELARVGFERAGEITPENLQQRIQQRQEREVNRKVKAQMKKVEKEEKEERKRLKAIERAKKLREKILRKKEKKAFAAEKKEKRRKMNEEEEMVATEEHQGEAVAVAVPQP